MLMIMMNEEINFHEIKHAICVGVFTHVINYTWHNDDAERIEQIFKNRMCCEIHIKAFSSLHQSPTYKF